MTKENVVISIEISVLQKIIIKKILKLYIIGWFFIKILQLVFLNGLQMKTFKQFK